MSFTAMAAPRWATRKGPGAYGLPRRHHRFGLRNGDEHRRMKPAESNAWPIIPNEWRRSLEPIELSDYIVGIPKLGGRCALADAVSIVLLGNPRVWRNGEEVAIPRKKTRAILYYLAACGHAVSRDRVISVIWPDKDIASARHNLSVSLSDIRKRLGNIFVLQNSTIKMGANVQVDTWLFAEKPPDDFVSAVGGVFEKIGADAFLYGFDLDDSPEFEMWKDSEGRRYCQLYIEGLASLSSAAETTEAWQDALSYCRRALELDPFREDLVRRGMGLSYRLGNRAQAITTFEDFRNRLDAELGIPPMPETRLWYDTIVAGADLPNARHEGTASAPHAAKALQKLENDLPFVGRTNEKRIVSHHVSAKEAGLLLVEGPAGIGKSRLLSVCLEEARSGNEQLLVLKGCARESEQAMLYQPITESLLALKQWKGWQTARMQLQRDLPNTLIDAVNQIIPDFITQSSIDRREYSDCYAIWESVRQLLAYVGSRVPLVVVWEDLQWASRTSIGLISFLVRNDWNGRVSFVASCRISPESPELHEAISSMEREGTLHVLELNELGSDDVAELAGMLAPKADTNLSSRLMYYSGGNPFLLREVFVYLQHNKMLVNAPEIRFSNATMPTSMKNFVKMNLAGFSSQEMGILDACSVLGNRFSTDLLAAVSTSNPIDTFDALGHFKRMGILVQDDAASYRFSHDITRAVVGEELGEGRAKSLHCRAAQAMEENRGSLGNYDDAIIAWHYLESTNPEASAPFSLSAGCAAMRIGSLSEAVDLFKQALPYLPPQEKMNVLQFIASCEDPVPLPKSSAEPFYRCAKLAAELGDEQLSNSYTASAMICEERDYCELYWGMDRAFSRPDTSGVFNLLESTLNGAKSASRYDLLPSLNTAMGICSMLTRDFDTALQHLDAAHDLLANMSLDDEISALLMMAVNMVRCSVLRQLNASTTERTILESIELSRRIGFTLTLPSLLVQLGKARLSAQSPDAAETAIREGLALAQQRKLEIIEADAHYALGTVCRLKNDEPGAHRQFEQARAIADQLHLVHLGLALQSV